jgi:hypothetical protein
MTLTTFYIILIVLALIVTILGVLTIRVAVQMYEQLYWHKPKPVQSFKQEAKKRYQRKLNNNATKRITKSTRKV